MMRALTALVASALGARALVEPTAYAKLAGLKVHRAIVPFERVEFTQLWTAEERCLAVFLRSYG